MPQLIGFNVYRTENLTINQIPYTVRFTLSNDSQEYRLFVSNSLNDKQASYSFSKESADDFEIYNSEKLESEVFKIIKSDVSLGII